MEPIVMELEIVTPMFIAGADTESAELRAPSIKGLMRFWWRAQQAVDWEDLRNKEADIFGSTERGANFSIRLDHQPLKSVKDDFPRYTVPVEGKSFPLNILNYLAYGLLYDAKKKEFGRERIPEDSQFNVVINIFRKEYQNEILKTLYIFNLFGGLGSRNRNGFGCVEIINKDTIFEPLKKGLSFSIDAPYSKANMEKIIKNKKSLSQSYPSFSEDYHLFKARKSFATWDESLADIGKIYYRSRLALEGGKRHCYQKRQYIGAPIVDNKTRRTESILERHGKPYFMKVTKEGGQYRSYILYLPSNYCDGLEKDRKGEKIDKVNVDKEFKDVCKEFNELLEKEMEKIV